MLPPLSTVVAEQHVLTAVVDCAGVSTHSPGWRACCGSSAHRSLTKYEPVPGAHLAPGGSRDLDRVDLFELRLAGPKTEAQSSDRHGPVTG
jgi:hypothetical protein